MKTGKDKQTERRQRATVEVEGDDMACGCDGWHFRHDHSSAGKRHHVIPKISTPSPLLTGCKDYQLTIQTKCRSQVIKAMASCSIQVNRITFRSFKYYSMFTIN
jgi:hypothetical protein